MPGRIMDPIFGPNQDQRIDPAHVFIAHLFKETKLVVTNRSHAKHRNGMAIYRVLTPHTNVGFVTVDTDAIALPTVLNTDHAYHGIPGLFGYFAVFGFTYGMAATNLPQAWKQCSYSDALEGSNDHGHARFDESGWPNGDTHDFSIQYQVGVNG
jgi:hypothetical protein